MSFFSLQETIHFGRGSRPSQEMFQLLARLQCAIHLGIFTKLPSGIVVENGSEGQVSYWNVNGQWLLSAGSACSRIHPSSAQSMRFCCLKPMFDLSEAPTVCTRDMLVPERILVHGRFTPDQGSWQMWGYRGVPSPFSGFKENQGHFWGPIPKVDEPPMSFLRCLDESFQALEVEIRIGPGQGEATPCPRSAFRQGTGSCSPTWAPFVGVFFSFFGEPKCKPRKVIIILTHIVCSGWPNDHNMRFPSGHLEAVLDFQFLFKPCHRAEQRSQVCVSVGCVPCVLTCSRTFRKKQTCPMMEFESN